MKTYEIHELAHLVPMASDSEQDALTNDIKANGQLETIKLYRGKVIDGRCRLKSCTDLGLEAKTESVPNNLSLAEVAKLVKSWNTRRNLTRTQKVISAYYQHRDNGLAMRAAATQWAVTQAEVSQIKFIDHHRPELILRLFNGHKVLVDRTTKRESSAVAAVYNFVRAEVESVTNPAQSSSTELAIMHKKLDAVISSLTITLNQDELNLLKEKLSVLVPSKS